MGGLRISFVCEEFPLTPGGGRAGRIYNIAKILAKEHEVHIYCQRYPMTPAESVLSGVYIHRVGFVSSPTSYLGRFLSSTLLLPRLLKDGHFDIINTNLLLPPLPSYIASKIMDTPIIFSCDGLMWHRISGLSLTGYEKGIITFGCLMEDLDIMLNHDAYIAVSEGTRRNLISLGAPPEKTFTVYNGTDLDFIDSIKAEKNGRPTICFIGCLSPHKDPIGLVKAFKIVLDSIPTARLIIVGSGNMMKRVKEIVRSLKIQRNVTFTGHVKFETSIKINKSSHILVLPSLVEGFGMVLIEANACRNPVIAYDIQCVREIVQNGVNGFLVRPRDIDMLADRIIRLLMDEDLRRKMGEKGRRIVEERFTWDKAAKETLKVYNYVLNNK